MMPLVRVSGEAAEPRRDSPCAQAYSVMIAVTRETRPMSLKRMDNVLIVVDDLEATKAFFIALGLKLEGETIVEGPLVGQLIGLKDVRSTIAMLRTPDGQGLELDKFHTPNAVRFGPVATPVNTLGIRRIMFAVDDSHVSRSFVRQVFSKQRIFSSSVNGHGRRRSVLPASSGVRLSLRLLHDMQQATTFDKESGPRRLNGRT